MKDAPIFVKIDPLVAELVPTFLERSRQNATEIGCAARSADFVTARRIGHALRGTAGSFGFEEMAEIGKQIEQAALAGDSAALKDLAGRLEAYLSRVRPVSG